MAIAEMLLTLTKMLPRVRMSCGYNENVSGKTKMPSRVRMICDDN